MVNIEELNLKDFELKGFSLQMTWFDSVFVVISTIVYFTVNVYVVR